MKQEKKKKHEKDKKEKGKPSQPSPDLAFVPLSKIEKDQKDVFAEIREKLELAEAMQEMFDEDKVEPSVGQGRFERKGRQPVRCTAGVAKKAKLVGFNHHRLKTEGLGMGRSAPREESLDLLIVPCTLRKGGAT